MRRVVLIAAGLLLLAGLAGAGAYWWRVWRFVESTDDAYVQGDISVIAPKVEGYIATLAVQDNQAVRRGEVLATIDDRDFRARVQAADAAVAVQQAAIANIDSQLALQESEIARARAALASAEAELARARPDYDRFKSLMKSDWVSHQRFESAEADLHKAESGLTERQAAVASEEHRRTVLAAQRRQAAALLQQAEAQLRLAQNALDDTVIRAPIDGVVGNRGVQLGQYVKAGTQLLSLVPLGAVYVVANFKETQLARMHTGQPVSIAVDAYPDQQITGHVESFAPASGAEFSVLPPENATGNFTKIVQRVPVRIAVPRDGPLAGRLRPGLSVVVTIDTRNPAEPMPGAALAAEP
jgi:membrane fusion protein (multidrug efflux system)